MTIHWRTPAGLHTASARLPVEGELPSFERRDRVAQLAAADGGRPAREGRPGQLLDLHLHQLAPPAPLRPRLGREILRPRAGRDRRAHARVRVRARPRQRPPGRAGHADRLPGRDRQRLRGMECLRQPLLAGPVLRRRAGAHPASPLRRRRIPAVGNGHPAAAGRGRIRRRGSRTGLRRCPRCRSARRLGHPEITGELHRLRAHRELRVPRRRGTGHSVTPIRPRRS